MTAIPPPPPPQDPEVSDVPIDNNNDNASNKDGCDNDGSGNKGCYGEETEDAAFHCAAREIMNRV